MDNPLAKTSDLEMGWLAGFFDGEGSFNIHHQRKRRWEGWKPWFTVANTHAETVNKVIEIMDKLGLAYHVSWNQDKRKNRKPIWRVEVTGLLRMRRLLNLITPYLFTKKRQAELLLEFVNLRLNHSGWREGLSEEEKSLVSILIKMNH